MSKISINRLRLTVASAATLMITLAIPSSVLADSNTDVQAAADAGVQYIANSQNSNGSISGLGGESEWSAVAVAADGQQAADLVSSTGSSLVDFLAADVPAPGAPATTIERKTIAVAAAGEDTSNFGGVNYNTMLAGLDVGNQIGDPTLLNDDAFGVIAIDATGDNSLTPVAQDGINYLLAHQAADGGFSYTTISCAWCGSDSNDTAAAIIAMYAAQDMGLNPISLTAQANALTYLLSTQQADGGFGYDAFSPSDGSSTAWGLMALNTIGQSVATQAQLARNWLLNNQNPDGGFSFGAYGFTSSDTYTTAHAVTALLGSTWLLSPEPIHQQRSVNNQASSGASPNPSQKSVTAAITQTTSDPTDPPTSKTQASSQPSKFNISSHAKFGKPAAQPTAAVAGLFGSLLHPAYAVAVLVLVALSWFVLESQQSKGVN